MECYPDIRKSCLSINVRFGQFIIYGFCLSRPLAKDKSFLPIRCGRRVPLGISHIDIPISAMFPNKSILHHSPTLFLVFRSIENFSIQYFRKIRDQIGHEIRLLSQVLNDNSPVITVRYPYAVIISGIFVAPDTRRMQLSKTFLKVFRILVESYIANSQLKDILSHEITVPQIVLNICSHIAGINTLNLLGFIENAFLLPSVKNLLGSLFHVGTDGILHHLHKLSILTITVSLKFSFKVNSLTTESLLYLFCKKLVTF